MSVIMRVFINIPIWFAFFQALYELYIQKTCDIKLKIKPYCGSFNEVSKNPSIVKIIRPTCATPFQFKYFFICLIQISFNIFIIFS